MKGSFTKITLGIVTVLSGGVFVPIVPSNLQAGLSEHPDVRAYQYPAGSDRHDYRLIESTTTGETVRVDMGMLPDADFTDEDGNGVISVGVFTDLHGNDVYKQIPDDEYALMGQKGGEQHNPQATELITLFEALAPPVEASITVDATSEGFQAAGTSLTVSHTVTGSNTAFINSIWMWNGTISSPSASYNGTVLTNLGSRSADFGTIYLWGMANPDVGTHNLVITNANSVQIFQTGASYTGVDQTTPFPNTTVTGSTNNTTYNVSLTTTVDQSWLFLHARTPSRDAVAGAGTTERKQNVVSADSASSFDSNAGLAVGSNQLQVTVSPSQTSYWVMTAMAPAAAGSTLVPSQNIILFE